MSVGDVFKWALVVVIGFLLWNWMRNGAHLNVGPGENSFTNNGGATIGGWIPFSGGKNGGITFGANVPWSPAWWPQPQPVGPAPVIFNQ
jgi:hypothetical protein